MESLSQLSLTAPSALLLRKSQPGCMASSIAKQYDQPTAVR